MCSSRREGGGGGRTASSAEKLEGPNLRVCSPAMMPRSVWDALPVAQSHFGHCSSHARSHRPSAGMAVVVRIAGTPKEST